jgi:hypothetical protein
MLWWRQSGKMTYNTFDMSSFEKLKTTHDGHGRVSCETKTELEKYFDLELVNKIVNKLYYEDFVDLSYDEFMEVIK